MKKSILFVILALATLFNSCISVSSTDSGSSENYAASKRNPLAGTSWYLDYVPESNQLAGEKIIKYYTDNHFVVSKVNADGSIQNTMSGTYSVKGNKYTENVLYTSGERKSLKGVKSEINYEISHNMLVLVGTVKGREEGFSETWVKAY